MKTSLSLRDAALALAIVIVWGTNFVVVRVALDVLPPLFLATLRFTPKKGAELILKVLESAVANAENNLSADIDELKVEFITVDIAPVLKRFHARAKGRGARIWKRRRLAGCDE